MNRTTRIQRLAPQDREEWQRLYYRHKEQRPRRRLLALNALWDGQTMAGSVSGPARPTEDAGGLARLIPARWLQGVAGPGAAAGSPSPVAATATGAALYLAAQDPGRIPDSLGPSGRPLPSTLHLHASAEGGPRPSPSRPGTTFYS
jgi:hypothetical protein